MRGGAGGELRRWCNFRAVVLFSPAGAFAISDRFLRRVVLVVRTSCYQITPSHMTEYVSFIAALRCFAPAVNHGKNGRHEKQRRDGSEQQSPNHRAAQRSILLAALAQAQAPSAPCR